MGILRHRSAVCARAVLTACLAAALVLPTGAATAITSSSTPQPVVTPASPKAEQQPQPLPRKNVDDMSQDELQVAPRVIVMSSIHVPNRAGYFTAEELAELTSEDGLLTTQLANLRPYTQVFVDPMIIASIQILGDAAPASAVEWLERSRFGEMHQNLMPYANADWSLIGEAYAVATGSDEWVNPSLYPWLPVGYEDLVPGPVPQNGSGNYTNYAVSYGSTPMLLREPVSERALQATGGNSRIHSVIRDTQLTNWPWATDQSGPMPSSYGVVNGRSMTIVNTAVSDVFNRAIRGDTDTAAAARAELLALFERAEPTLWQRQRWGLPVVIEVTDSATVDVALLEATYAAMHASGLMVGWSMIDVPIGAPQTGLTLKEYTPNADQLEYVAEYIRAEAHIASFGPALVQPGAAYDWERLRMLAYTAEWGSLPPTTAGYAEALEEERAHLERYRNGIMLEASSDITLISSEAPLTLSVINRFPTEARVRVIATSLSDRLSITSPEAQLLPAQSKTTLQFPVEGFANGRATIRVQIQGIDADGNTFPIGDPMLVRVDVQAMWGTVLLVLLLSALVALTGIGIWRSVRKRRLAVRSTDE